MESSAWTVIRRRFTNLRKSAAKLNPFCSSMTLMALGCSEKPEPARSSNMGIGVGGGVLMLGTLGKAAGSFGAFIAGDAVYIDSLIQHARSYIYTTALPPSIASATRAAIKIIQTEPERRDKLNANITYFRQAIDELNLKTLDSKTAIQPILLGDSETALQATELLRQHGLWITAIRPPTVPEGTARLRITISCEHHQNDIDQLITALRSDAMRKLTETLQ